MMRTSCLAHPVLADGMRVAIGDRLLQRVDGTVGRVVGVVVESGRVRCGCGCRRRVLVLEDEVSRVRYNLSPYAEAMSRRWLTL